jgi:site-specific DNA-methyltransferase (adenine-specific)
MAKITLYHGDCLEIAPTLVGVGAIISDPPYGMDYDNDNSRFTSGPKTHGKGGGKKHRPIKGDKEPFDPTPWIEFPHVVLWGYNHFASRLPVGTTLVWIKRLEQGYGTFLSDAELAWMKGGKGTYCHRDTSLYGKARNRLHPNEKPVGLMRWCLERAKLPKGTIVLDPYMGSAATGVACIQMGYDFIGIEVDKEHFQTAQNRLNQELERVAAQPFLFPTVSER